MGIKTYRPRTPSLRSTVTLTFDELTRSCPEKSLTKGHPDKAGRGAGGRISVRRRGDGHKRRYRIIDFKRDKFGIAGTVREIEYDPNRSANIALIFYADGEKRYILCPKGLSVGTQILSGQGAPIEVGNALSLDEIPVGRVVHNVEMEPGRGAQLVRTAGASALIMAKEGKFVTLKLPSGEMRMINKRCLATIGEIGNEDHMNVNLGKAGRNRWLGNRPKVRGVVMNPVDHPHGGGEGRTSGGRHPVSPWGQPTRGYKTRKKRKNSSKLIVKRRK